MNVKVEEMMIHPVVTTFQHKSVGHAREVMQTNRIHSLPVIDSEGGVKGIVTANDLLNGVSDNTPVSKVMSKDVLTIPKYSGIHIAARIMRNHKIRHLVVTHEKQIVGILSAFDLLKLVQEHRFVMKNAPTKTKKGGKRK